MRRLGVLFILLLTPGLLFAQITVESITTDTIDLFVPVQSSDSQHSSSAAMALSLLLPGLGHQYTERPNAALAYLTLDVLSVVGIVFCERYSRQFESNSYGFAATHAGVYGNVNSERYWQMVGTFSSMNAYNETARLAREEDQIYNDEMYYWKWNSDESKERYNQMRDNSRKLHIASSFCIGAMVLNRVLAFVDVRAATRFRRSQLQTSFSVKPSIRNPGINILTKF